MPTDYEGLLPRGVAQNFVGMIEQRSIALTLGNTMRMSDATESVPLVSFLPTAEFVNPRYGGRKPVTKVEWSAEQLVAEEIAAIVPVPTAWIRDADFDVEGQVEQALSGACARCLDAAVLFGAGAPATYPPNGVVGAGAPVGGADALAAIDAGLSAVEASGVIPTGIGSGTAIGSALRAAYREAGALPGEAPTPTIYGLPVVTTIEWDETKGDAVVGDWTKLAVGIREDIGFARTDTGVLQDDAGAIVANMFQDNLTAVKVTFWVGVAIGTPIKPDNTPADAFVAVDWTAGA